MLNNFLLLFALPFLFSFNFSPMTQTISLDNNQTSTQYLIENNSKNTIPVTVKVVGRIQKEDGKEDLPQTKLIQVFPPQLIIPPGEKKTIRVNWLGSKEIKSEEAFRIIAEQVPLDIDKKNAKNSGGIKMLLRYMNALYVTPKDAKSNLSIKAYGQKNKLRVYIQNTGNSHQYLKNVRIKFIDKKKEYSIPAKELSKLDGQNILARTIRYFEFSKLNSLPKNLKGIIEFDD